ncbi:MAG: hypothetical protein IJT21_06540 [Synergistaceae bacterium]|nr:hypothetical protein [Synergistaceae bacterium]
MYNGLAHQRVLRTVRLLPQAVKIGILESEIKQEGNKPPDNQSEQPGSAKTVRAGKNSAQKLQVNIPSPDAKELDELTAQIKALTNSLGTAELANSQLSEAKARLESEIGGIKSEYEARRRTLESEANANAKKIADEARTKAQQEGFNKGYNEGLTQARQEVEQEYLTKFADLAGVIDNLGQKLNENFAELVKLNQPRLIRVWTEMLRRMLHRQVELNPDTIDSVLTEVLARLSDKNQVLIYVSPEDLKHVESNIDSKFQDALRGVKRLEIKPDSSVEKGACIVETSLGVYDARWKTQMSQVESVVDEVFQQAAKED